MAQILLVEDEVDLAKVILNEIKKEGFQGIHVADGASALQKHHEQKPDLIILDWMLPDMSGLDVLKEIRLVSGVPILMLTARNHEADRIVGLEMGADDYLTKPFSLRELMARIRALLRRMDRIQKILEEDKKSHQKKIILGSLTIDPESHTVIQDGNVLDLTPIEYKLLSLFTNHPGRAFSRDYLLDAVWGEDVVVTDRVVDNAVLKLRKKLGKMADSIETIWSVGYRFRRPSE